MTEKRYVTFYSPGTLFAEQTRLEIEEWDVEQAVKMSRSIVERHNSHPYGFRFSTVPPNELDSQKTSPMYYLGGKVETVEEIKQRNDPRESILLSNMENNGYDRVWRTTSGWQWSQPLSSDDVVIENPYG